MYRAMTEGNHALPSLRLLLIEDDEDDYVIVRDLLSDLEHGTYELHWASNFDDGMERLLRCDADACLLDYRLGMRTGMELLYEAKRRGCNVPIIFLTGHTDRAIDMEALRAGAIDYLVKNELTPMAMDRAIRYAVDHARSMLKLEELASELEAAHQRALKASHAKGEFLAMISHELRTPLNAILGYAEMIHEELDRLALDHLAQDVGEIKVAGSHLLSLINELLDTSQAEAGKLTLHISPFAVAPLVQEIAATMRPLVGRNDNQLELVCPPDIGGMISDPVRLRQVFVNILGNACKFTTHGRIKLIVREEPAERITRRVAAPGAADDLGWLEFHIEDTGIGMTPEQLCRIFEGFAQADQTISRTYGGTGLGLVISRHLVKLMGGDILADSTSGVGTVFRVRVPRIAPGARTHVT
jgi:signal transduction histidine kinase